MSRDRRILGMFTQMRKRGRSDTDANAFALLFPVALMT